MANNEEKRKRGRPRGKRMSTATKPNRSGESVHVYIDSELRRAVEEAVRNAEPRTTLTAFAEAAFRYYLRVLASRHRSADETLH